MADLKAVTQRIRANGAKRPTPETRVEVVSALSSKWEGVQAVAVDVLAGATAIVWTTYENFLPIVLIESAAGPFVVLWCGRCDGSCLKRMSPGCWTCTSIYRDYC